MESGSDAWRAKQDWRFRFGQLELGSCDQHLSYGGEQDRAEISKWEASNKSRYVVAHFRRLADGFELVWIGDRPLECDWEDFRRAAELGFCVLFEGRAYRLRGKEK